MDLGGFLGVMARVGRVAVRMVGMLGGFFVVALLVVLLSFLMMSSRFSVMLRGLPVMLSGRMSLLAHGSS
ncbi:MAG TPA: hypothetical protein VK066_26715 [Chloroflexota bacterium]|nr:hypothetical protein [Chloroflexota bacterium]